MTWRRQCAEAADYAAYLRLPVWEKHACLRAAATLAVSSGEDAPSTHDCPAGPPALRRSMSFSVAGRLKPVQSCEEICEDPAGENDGDGDAASPLPSPSRLAGHHRTHSLSSLNFLQEHRGQRSVDLEQDLGASTTDLLLSTAARLKEERLKLRAGQDSGLEFLLSGVVKRNHLGLERLLTSNARDVEVAGQYGLAAATRRAIAAYYDEVSRGLELLAEGDTRGLPGDASPARRAAAAARLRGRMLLFRKMKQNIGRTALMLSGGGAQAMYHLGTMRALIDTNLYHKIKVISGTSGGSIAAACCAMFTPEEIARDICQATVSTDLRLTGEMKVRYAEHCLCLAWFDP